MVRAPPDPPAASALTWPGSLAARGVIDADAMPFKAWFDDDHRALRKYGWREASRELNAAFAGMPVTAFRDSARAWLADPAIPASASPTTSCTTPPCSS